MFCRFQLLHIEDKYYSIDFTIDEIRPTYRFNATCQRSVPEALECFFESTDFEDTVRNAISLGGDADTLAAIAGSVAEAFYGIPDNIKNTVFEYLDGVLTDYYRSWHDKYMK